jgi:hypothetical protein
LQTAVLIGIIAPVELEAVFGVERLKFLPVSADLFRVVVRNLPAFVPH